ncbi:NACHT domain-containing protein [Actinocorallia herbida]|uniref:NACHT domain-containing protein n=1 Tax=Actinocorallia herbida TaxID=58109 RepID=A0A3N1CZ04_9ACTN|nr:NACHT domain-containing protein [Actinocorallia herbida]ROO86507.1 NACHT domain-containing protein [Actinocorallia herbida]
MRSILYTVLTLMSAFTLVAAGVAVNQILDDGELSRHWAYLAFGLAVAGALFATALTQTARESAASPGVRRRAYMRRVRAAVSDMETIGVVTQGEFVLRSEQVYVDVMLQPRPAADIAADSGIGTDEPDDTDAGEPGNDPSEADRRSVGDLLAGRRQPLGSFLKRGSVLAVLGAAGSGKTTLARHTTLDLAGRRPWGFWRHRPVPVLLYLRDHATGILGEKPQDLAEAAASARWLRGVIPANWLRARLDRGRCVVLLDGLDEVASEADRRRVRDWVTDQIGRYPENSFVITSRPHGYLSNPLPNADVLQVQRFTVDQIARFLRAWYRAVEQRARQGSPADVQAHADRKSADLIARVRDTPALQDLAANPLLLTMIALVHRYRGELPGSRAGLYAEMCIVLLHRRSEAKNLADPTELSGSQKETVIRHLALHMMRNQRRDIRDGEAWDAIDQPLKAVTERLTARAFLDGIRACGLLVERESGLYGFAHLTLQEYLAAAHLRAEPGEAGLLTSGVDDPWWRETTLLWAAGADATPVVEACLASGTVRALALAFDCADQAERLTPTARQRLNRLLTETGADDPARTRLTSAVAASRVLYATVRLPNGTGVCARPVIGDLWHRFVADARRRRLSLPDHAGGQEVATGMWATDAVLYLDWLNRLFDDGTGYRFPDQEEMAHPGVLEIPSLARRPVWVRRDAELVLHVPPGVAHPYALRNEVSVRLARLIADHLHFPLALAGGSSLLGLPELLVYARLDEGVGDIPVRRQATLLELVVTVQALVAFAREPGAGLRARTYAFGRARTLLEGFPVPQQGWEASAGDLRLAELHADSTREITRIEGLAQRFGGGYDQALGRDLHRLHNALVGYLREFHGPAGVGYQGIFSDLSVGPRFAFDPLGPLRTVLQPTVRLGLPRGRSRDLSVACARVKESADPDPARLALAREIALQRPIDGSDGGGFGLTLARTFTDALNGAEEESTGARAFKELALARAHRRKGLSLDEVMIAVAESLTGAWTEAQGGRRRAARAALFEDFLRTALESLLPGTPWAGDPLAALQHALEELPADCPREVTDLLSGAQRLLGPVWDRRQHAVRTADVAMAAAAVLTALLLLRSSGAPAPVAVERLRGLLGMLAVIATGQEVGGQAVVLVRV